MPRTHQKEIVTKAKHYPIVTSQSRWLWTWLQVVILFVLPVRREQEVILCALTGYHTSTTRCLLLSPSMIAPRITHSVRIQFGIHAYTSFSSIRNCQQHWGPKQLILLIHLIEHIVWGEAAHWAGGQLMRILGRKGDWSHSLTW